MKRESGLVTLVLVLGTMILVNTLFSVFVYTKTHAYERGTCVAATSRVPARRDLVATINDLSIVVSDGFVASSPQAVKAEDRFQHSARAYVLAEKKIAPYPCS